METIAGPYIDQVFGAEATIWSESIDDQVLDMRIWPRASALAERLWTNSDDHWRRVEPRILWNNQRLAEIGGLEPERFQLEWCLQNE
jgi:hexosaminidase